MRLRGAPLLGVSVAFGMVLAIRNSEEKDLEKSFKKGKNYLSSLRPTAVNLFSALQRMERVFLRNKRKKKEILEKILIKEACLIKREDEDVCQKIGENGSKLIPKKGVVLTHCNAGALATSGIGTALGVIFTAKKKGKKVKVYATETRPLLQGARLTAWELKENGIEVTLIGDDMAGWLMKKKNIDLVLVGADRVALNGDTANKIGTYSLAILAKFHNIPLYVAAPLSSFDPNLRTGKEIPIEERDPTELTSFSGKRIAPLGIKVFNPAFDVTPASLITSFITEKGIFTPSSVGLYARNM